MLRSEFNLDVPVLLLVINVFVLVHLIFGVLKVIRIDVLQVLEVLLFIDVDHDFTRHIVVIALLR